MLKRIIVSLVGFYLVAIGYLYVTQEDQVFNAKMLVVKEQNIPKKGVEEVSLDVEGARLKGLYRNVQKDAPLLLYFGGNADDAREFVSVTYPMLCCNVLTFNYRGYVHSSGTPSQKALFADALSIYDTYAKGKEVIVVGRSLGTGVATYLASKRDVKGLILITPYDSILSMAKQKYPYFPIDVLLKHPFETTKDIVHVKTPIAIIEVENDTTIPKFHLDRLLEILPSKPYHTTLKNTTHGDVLDHPNFNNELQTLLGKIRE